MSLPRAPAALRHNSCGLHHLAPTALNSCCKCASAHSVCQPYASPQAEKASPDKAPSECLPCCSCRRQMSMTLTTTPSCSTTSTQQVRGADSHPRAYPLQVAWQVPPSSPGHLLTCMLPLLPPVFHYIHLCNECSALTAHLACLHLIICTCSGGSECDGWHQPHHCPHR